MQEIKTPLSYIYITIPAPPPSKSMSSSSAATSSKPAAEAGPPGGGVQRRQPQATRCIAVVMLVVILLSLLAIVVIWVAVEPKKLVFSIEHSSINATSATYHCLLRSRNPNKRVSFDFKRIHVAVMHYKDKVFEGEVGPFRQPRRNVTDIEVELPAAGAMLRGRGGEVEVRMEGRMHIKIGLFKVHRTVVADCGPYHVAFSEAEGFKRVECDTEISY